MRAFWPFAVLAAVLVVATGSSTLTARPASGSVPVVSVTVKDFKLSTDRATVPAQVFELRVTNQGPDTHEVLVVPATGGDGSLPLRADGITVDEEDPALGKVGAVEDIAPGTSRSVRLHLRPGRYELFCNMAGHYMTGMHTLLVVTAIGRPS